MSRVASFSSTRREAPSSAWALATTPSIPKTSLVLDDQAQLHGRIDGELGRDEGLCVGVREGR